MHAEKAVAVMGGTTGTQEPFRIRAISGYHHIEFANTMESLADGLYFWQLADKMAMK